MNHARRELLARLGVLGVGMMIAPLATRSAALPAEQSQGRCHLRDDWQFYDTMVTNFEYDDKLLSWEGNSCSGMKLHDRDRGSTIVGAGGTALVDRDGYEIYDLKRNHAAALQHCLGAESRAATRSQQRAYFE